MRIVMLALAAALAAAVVAETPPHYVVLMPPRVTPPEPLPSETAPAESLAPEALSPEPMPSEAPPALPEDPLQRVAYRAVVLQEWPEAPGWKLDIYERVLEEGITVRGQARRTTYCRRCAGRTCADGSRVRDGICAASRNIPMHAIIWLASDGLLKVTDRGGLVRVDRGCRARGETANFDVWRPRCMGHCWTGPGTLARVPWAMIPPQRDVSEIACRGPK